MIYDNAGRLLGYRDTITSSSTPYLVTESIVSNVYYDEHGQMEGYDQWSNDATFLALKTSGFCSSYSVETAAPDLNITNGYLNFDVKGDASSSFIITVKVNVVNGSNVSSDYNVNFMTSDTFAAGHTEYAGADITYYLGKRSDLMDGQWHSALPLDLNLYKIIAGLGGNAKVDHVSYIKLSLLGKPGQDAPENVSFKNISFSKDSLLTDIKPLSVKNMDWQEVDSVSGRTEFTAPNQSELVMKHIERRNFKYNELQQITGYRDTIWSSDNPAVETVKTVSASVYNGMGQVISSDESTETRQNTLTVYSPGTSLYGIASKTDNILYKDANLKYYDSPISSGTPLPFLSFEFTAKNMEGLRADGHSLYPEEDFILYVAA